MIHRGTDAKVLIDGVEMKGYPIIPTLEESNQLLIDAYIRIEEAMLSTLSNSSDYDLEKEVMRRLVPYMHPVPRMINIEFTIELPDNLRGSKRQEAWNKKQEEYDKKQAQKAFKAIREDAKSDEVKISDTVYNNLTRF